jgi:peptidoglycan/LPS O-acetylase OafA/YrhL
MLPDATVVARSAPDVTAVDLRTNDPIEANLDGKASFERLLDVLLALRCVVLATVPRADDVYDESGAHLAQPIDDAIAAAAAAAAHSNLRVDDWSDRRVSRRVHARRPPPLDAGSPAVGRRSAPRGRGPLPVVHLSPVKPAPGAAWLSLIDRLGVPPTGSSCGGAAPPARTERDLTVGSVELEGPEVASHPGSGAVSGWGSSEYRPYLDGLRAVAVYLVVLFHAGSDRFTGGYVGVDVFFVLSGFLVTQLLLRDLSTQGSIGFRRFYSRRFRRLLPAAFVCLIVTACVYTALASPVEVQGAVGAFKAAFLYVTNWYFIHQSADYFAADITTNPVLHFWSLAVEEQFYLLWPVLLGGLFLATRRLRAHQWQALRIVVAAGALASLAWALSQRTVNPSRAYYGTDARAYQLLAGALLALAPTLLTRVARYQRIIRGAGVAALAALLFVASASVHLDAIQRGTAVTAITIVILIALETANGGVAQRALSTEPMTYLGKVSYGTYLWHWPVIVVLNLVFHLSTLTTIAITALVATALASLSYQLLERPVRQSPLLDRHRLAVIGTGLAISIISAIVLIPAITNPDTTTTAAAADLTTTGFTPVPEGLDFKAARNEFTRLPKCLGAPASACTLVHGTGKSMVLMGDSNAGMLIPAFVALAKRENLTLTVVGHVGCPWQRNLFVVPVPLFGKMLKKEDCENAKNDAYDRVIPAATPDIIVVINVGYSDQQPPRSPYLGPDGKVLDTQSTAYDSWLEKTTSDSLAQLAAGGRKVVMIEPIPLAMNNFDPLSCLSKAEFVEACRYIGATEPSRLELLYRRLDEAGTNVWSADFDHVVCPYLPICDPILNGQIVKFDGGHLTARYAVTIAPAIDAYLTQNGVLPP